MDWLLDLINLETSTETEVNFLVASSNQAVPLKAKPNAAEGAAHEAQPTVATVAPLAVPQRDHHPRRTLSRKLVLKSSCLLHQPANF